MYDQTGRQDFSRRIKDGKDHEIFCKVTDELGESSIQSIIIPGNGIIEEDKSEENIKDISKDGDIKLINI